MFGFRVYDYNIIDSHDFSAAYKSFSFLLLLDFGFFFINSTNKNYF